MNTRGLPAMLAPRYQDWQFGYTVRSVVSPRVVLTQVVVQHTAALVHSHGRVRIAAPRLANRSGSRPYEVRIPRRTCSDPAPVRRPRSRVPILGGSGPLRIASASPKSAA